MNAKITGKNYLRILSEGWWVTSLKRSLFEPRKVAREEQIISLSRVWVLITRFSWRGHWCLVNSQSPLLLGLPIIFDKENHSIGASQLFAFSGVFLSHARCLVGLWIILKKQRILELQSANRSIARTTLKLKQLNYQIEIESFHQRSRLSSLLSFRIYVKDREKKG